MQGFHGRMRTPKQGARVPRLLHIDCGHGTYRCVYHFAKVSLGPCAGEEGAEGGRGRRRDAGRTETRSTRAQAHAHWVRTVYLGVRERLIVLFSNVESNEFGRFPPPPHNLLFTRRVVLSEGPFK